MKKLLFIALSLLIIMLLQVGCDATIKIKADNSAEIDLLFNKSMARNFGFNMNEYTHIEDFQDYLNRELSLMSSENIMKIESFKKADNFWEMKIKMQALPEVDFSSILSKFAIGKAVEVVNSFGSFKYGSENLISTSNDINQSIGAEKMYAYDSAGREVSSTAIELLLERGTLKSYSAIYTNQDIVDMKYKVPGNIELILTDKENIFIIDKRTFLLPDDDYALVIYKNPRNLTALWVVLGVIGLWIFISIIKRRKYNL